ncbi:MAG: hypothetical protein DMD57_13970 [Gemmatimonadetes bacterium]|nr:MAG: hypothetical protein DMD57_13970 [Gemmatimonadota bacterium]
MLATVLSPGGESASSYRWANDYPPTRFCGHPAVSGQRTLLPRRLSYPAEVALLAALYFVAAKLGLLAAVAQAVVSSAWPPAGLALAALLLLGVRYWPGIAIGAFLVNASAGVPLAGAAGIGVGNTLEAVVGALLLQRVARFRPSLERLRDVLALVLLAAALSTTVSATIGVASLWLSGAISPAAYGSLWFVWWSGDAMGVLVFGSLLLTWAATPRLREAPRRAVEALALVVLLVVLTDALFRLPFNYAYAIFPVVSWGEPGPAADLCGAAGRDGPSGRGPHDGARNSAAGVDRIGGALSGAVREQPKPSFRLYPRHVGAARRQRGRGRPVRLHARRISGDDPRGDASARRRARPARPRCQV